MKHAVMIMAHKNPRQVVRLIKTLNCPEFDFYVHFDSNLDLSGNDVQEIKSAGDNVYFCEKRIHGELDKWSLVQIVLNLIDLALDNEGKKGISYSYFLLLSGQDYPIKSKEYIIAFLKEQYPMPLVHVDKYEDEYWVRTKFMLVRWTHKIDDIHDRMKPGIFRKLCVAPYVIAENLERAFYGSPYERLSKLGVKLYGGSAWWILPHGVIEYIEGVRNNKPKIIKEFIRTWTPEETFFQTMTMNSPYGRYLENGYPPIYDSERGDLPSMTYADFFTSTKQFKGHPHIITDADFERIMAKKALFARKFDTSVDEKILDMIEETITNEKC